MKKIIKIVFVLACSTFIFFSCSKDFLFTHLRDKNEIRPSVCSNIVSATKAGDGSGRVLKNEDGSLILFECVSHQDNMPLTKGSELTSEAINTNGSSFLVDAFVEQVDNPDDDPHFMRDISCVKMGSEWKWQGADPRWEDNIDMYFWGRSVPADAGVTFTSFSKTQVAFSYAAPATSGADFQNSRDIALSFNKEKRDISDDGSEIIGGGSSKYNVTFRHALAAIRFELAPNGIADDVNIKYIKLTGLYGAGNCVASGTGNGDGSSVSYVWTPTGDKRDFKQVLSTTKKSTDGRTRLLNGELTKGGTLELFMLPQTLSNVKVEIQFAKHGYVLTKTVSLSNTRWDAGYYYTYRLSATVHAPGDEIPINEAFSVKGFMNDPSHVRTIPENGGYYEAIDVTLIGIKITHSYYDSSGKSVGYIYAVSKDGTMNTKGTTVEYDFKPVPSTIDWPYSGGDGITETYTGYTRVASTGKTQIDEYYVYNVDGFGSFSLAIYADGDANNARWSGTFVKTYVLEMNGAEPE